MVSCPKCGSAEISGPTYCNERVTCELFRRNPLTSATSEHLHYRCRRCGYLEARLCLDDPWTTDRKSKDPQVDRLCTCGHGHRRHSSGVGQCMMPLFSRDLNAYTCCGCGGFMEAQ